MDLEMLTYFVSCIHFGLVYLELFSVGIFMLSDIGIFNMVFLIIEIMVDSNSHPGKSVISPSATS